MILQWFVRQNFCSDYKGGWGGGGTLGSDVTLKPQAVSLSFMLDYVPDNNGTRKFCSVS